jgi:hypothetical protein
LILLGLPVEPFAFKFRAFSAHEETFRAAKIDRCAVYVGCGECIGSPRAHSAAAAIMKRLSLSVELFYRSAVSDTGTQMSNVLITGV